MSLAPHRSIAIRTRSSSPQLNSPPPTIRIRCSPFVTLLLPGGLCSRFRRKGLSAHREVAARHRSEEHTSELQSLMRISYAVFCLKKTKIPKNNQQTHK